METDEKNTQQNTGLRISLEDIKKRLGENIIDDLDALTPKQRVDVYLKLEKINGNRTNTIYTPIAKANYNNGSETDLAHKNVNLP